MGQEIISGKESKNAVRIFYVARASVFWTSFENKIQFSIKIYAKHLLFIIAMAMKAPVMGIINEYMVYMSKYITTGNTRPLH